MPEANEPQMQSPWSEQPQHDWIKTWQPMNAWNQRRWEPQAAWQPKSGFAHKSFESKDDSFSKKDEIPNNYEFGYGIHDEKTGDIKQHLETASNGVVKGQYSLIDSDGFRRIVEYTADDVHGFQAIVKREPISPPKKKEDNRRQWW